MTTSPAGSLCVIGSANLDLIFRTPRFPQPGETIGGHSWLQNFGGKGANQAVIAARLGSQVAMVGCVGDDEFGQRMRENFRQQSVNDTFLFTVAGSQSGVACIAVDDAGENVIIGIPGANATLMVEQVRQAEPAIAGADVTLAVLEVPVPAIVEGFRLAKAAGRRTVLNPAPAFPLPEEIWPTVDLCVPNRGELGQMTGLPTATTEEVIAAAQSLRKRGVAAVLVSLGADGALLVTATAEPRLLPAPPVKPADTTGAGDALVGSLAHHWAAGANLSEAAEVAVQVAAYTVTRPGTQGSYPTAREFGEWQQAQGLG